MLLLNENAANFFYIPLTLIFVPELIAQKMARHREEKNLWKYPRQECIRYMNVKKLPVFRNLSDEELEKSLHCARSILVNFQKDEYIYRQEDEPKRLYFVLEGKVELGRAHSRGGSFGQNR